MDKGKLTFSKKMIIVITTVSILFIFGSFVLSFLDKEPLETLSVALVTEVIAVSLGYFCKSYLETKESEKTRLEEEQIRMNKGDME